MVGLGTQDNFPYAQEFVDTFGVSTVKMLWDPTAITWQAFGVTANSQMALVAPDLSQGTQLFFGFDKSREVEILEILDQL